MDYSNFRPDNTLGKKYCVYFKFISLLALFILIFFTLSAVYQALTKNNSASFYLAAIIGWLTYFFIYFQNRLFFDMCQGSLQ